MRTHEALNQLDSCIRLMLEIEHKSGIAEGSDMLARLGYGSATVADFGDQREAAQYSRHADRAG